MALSRSALPVIDDDARVRREAQDLLERAHALAHAFGVRRQAEILQHDRGLEAAHLRQRLLAIARDEHFVFVEAPAQLLLQADVVFDDQQPRLSVTSARQFRS